MSFWNTSNNAPVVAKTEVDQNNDLEPIPSGTTLRSIITEAKWAHHEGDEYISIRWDVIDGEYKGRVVFQKLRVKDSEDKKRDKAIEMLAGIDANAGGKLMSSGEAPTDMSMMQNLCNKPMVIRVAVWAIEDSATGETKKGNWVNGVFSSAVLNKKQAPATQTFDDDIEF